MIAKKFLDWRGWWEGLYLTWIDGVSGTVLAWASSNLADSSGISAAIGTGNVGLNWKQASGVLLSVTIVRVFTYLKAKPLPVIVEESVETNVKSTDPTTGVEVKQSSKVVTTTTTPTIPPETKP